jgi:nitrogen-specific signal transduction histidine kinase
VSVVILVDESAQSDEDTILNRLRELDSIRYVTPVSISGEANEIVDSVSEVNPDLCLYFGDDEVNAVVESAITGMLDELKFCQFVIATSVPKSAINGGVVQDGDVLHIEDVSIDQTVCSIESLLKMQTGSQNKQYQRIRTFAEESPTFFLVVDSSFTVVDQRDIPSQFVDFTFPDMISQSFHDFIHPDDQDKLLEGLHELIDGDSESVSFTTRIAVDHGQTGTEGRPDHVGGSPSDEAEKEEHTEPEGGEAESVEMEIETEWFDGYAQNLSTRPEIQGILLSFEHSTDRKEYENKLKQQLDNLSILNKMVRHDIRNDLQLVQAYLDLLDGHVIGENQKHVSKALNSTESAIDLTVTARDLTETMRKVNPETQPIMLRPYIVEQIKTLEASRSDVDIQVEGDIPTAKVEANEMVESVFRNIIQNAIEHNEEEIAQITISGEVSEDDGSLSIHIADNGPGIPDSEKDSVVAEGHTTLQTGGSGLGLYLVKTVMEDYGGTVSISDNNPKGAIVTVTFNLSK